jgi:5-methylcytosine-specific restriction endonuclease McrA
MTHCVLLNADYSFLNLVDWKRALRLIANGKVMVLHYSEKIIQCNQKSIVRMPSVMKLVKLVKTLYRIRIPFNKKNVVARDNLKCAYCGTSKKALTIDHILPKSRGGATDFENCVASCRDCNAAKRNLTPKEARMTLHITPYHPTLSEFMRIKAKQMGVFETLMDLGIY